MIYKVRARYIEENVGAFFMKLTDGTIEGQVPDGAEIVASMKRARITESGVVAWYEQCFCETPLAHERETCLDLYFSDMTTKLVEEYGEVTGESFWDFLCASEPR